VRRRNFGFGHGIGRSGELSAIQPKAAGSSLYARLTQCMAMHALKLAGLTELKACLVVPLATGMSLMLAMMAVRARNANPNAKYAVWMRIDQATCFKSMLSVGLVPVIVENAIEVVVSGARCVHASRQDDQLVTDIGALKRVIGERGAENIACCISTTSCFAPRAPDAVIEVARVCQQLNVAHIVNNAYGVQVGQRARC
jgi:O-phospho-L-seryl-tRNASec:L-selenocysteinyl-tRNA synthase